MVFKWFLNGFFNGRILVLLIVTSLTSRAACLASDTTSPAAQPVGGSWKRKFQMHISYIAIIVSSSCPTSAPFSSCRLPLRFIRIFFCLIIFLIYCVFLRVVSCFLFSSSTRVLRFRVAAMRSWSTRPRTDFLVFIEQR